MPTSISTNTQDRLPDPVAPIVDLMSSFPAPWALCGGWAVDAWLGRKTREHVDVDIAVFVQDQAGLLQHLRAWQLVAHDARWSGDTNEPWRGRPLEVPAHIHARLDTGEDLPKDGPLLPDRGFVLDIQFNDRSAGDWILWREPRLSIPLRQSVRQRVGGPPMVVPEVLLFYKAQDLRRRDKADFQALLPLLGDEQREWLRHAIALVGHPWLPRLSA
ncbi:MAG TPA: hypothetical protein VEZ14_10965 [Dehalococcoidia bacterium]|nr:hypothetical protein [Dehalococcoidia bacterium]